jgi:hypothetical protein
MRDWARRGSQMLQEEGSIIEGRIPIITITKTHSQWEEEAVAQQRTSISR